MSREGISNSTQSSQWLGGPDYQLNHVKRQPALAAQVKALMGSLPGGGR